MANLWGISKFERGISSQAMSHDKWNQDDKIHPVYLQGDASQMGANELLLTQAEIINH